MIIVLSGASGFIGSALVRAFREQGHETRPLVRRAPRSETEIAWDVDRGTIDSTRLEGADAVIHLAGEPLLQRWTDAARRRIRESRARGTTLLATALASLARPPRVLLSGSAIGIYGDRGDEILDESSRLGDDFLASVCRDWEAASAPASAAGIRVVSLRTGLVLGRGGGVLAKMLLPFRLGVGGRLGNGRQWMSWISLGDYCDLVGHCVRDDAIAGPINAVAPAAVTNAELTRTLGRVLRRPAPFSVPRAALRLVLGRMADEAVLASQRVRPARALAAGFAFTYGTLDAALRAELRNATQSGRSGDR